MTTLLKTVELKWQKERLMISTALTTSPQGRVMVHKHQYTTGRSRQCQQNLHGVFLRAIMPMIVGSGIQAIADIRVMEGLRTPPPRWASAQLLYVWVSRQLRSRLCNQNLCRPSYEVSSHYITLWVATALLVAGLTLTLWIHGQTLFTSIFKHCKVLLV